MFSKILSKKVLAALALTSLLVAGGQASAAEDSSAWVGGVFGMSVPDADNTSARPMYGLTGGAKLGSEWGIGGYFLSSSKEESVLGTTVNFKYQFYGVEFAYHFEGEAKGVFVGGRVGMSKVGATVSGISFETSPAHYGPVAGYNYMLVDGLSLGGEFSYLHVGKGSSTSNGATVETKEFNTLNFLVALRAWF